MSEGSVAINSMDELIFESTELLGKRLGHGEIRRVELARKGHVELEWVDGAVSRWFRWMDGDAHELLPEDDKQLPLLQQLQDPERARRLRILSWRPGRRVTLLDGSGNRKQVLKGYRVKRMKQALARYEAARHALQGTRVQCPEIIDTNADLGSLAMVFYAGHRLGLSTENARFFGVAARALRQFQQSSAGDQFGEFGAGDELAVIRARLERLGQFDEKPDQAWTELFDRLQQLSAQLPPSETGFVHRDLHDKQFVVEGRQLVILDFDLACAGDRLLDPGNFLAHLVLRQLQGVMGASQHSIEICSERFLDGLKGFDTPGSWQRLRFYQASTFCRLALIYRLRPRWRGLVPGLTGIGHRCLDDLKRISSR